MADAFTFIIRFVHVVSGVMWIGGLFLWGMVVAPNIMKRGPPQIRFPFLDTILRPLSRYMNLAGALTILSGFWVVGLLAGWPDYFDVFRGGYAGVAYGAALGVGVLAALSIAVMGNLVIQPTAHRMLDVMRTMTPGAPPPAELPMLGKRLGIASMISMALAMVALGGMVWAVNTVR